MPAERLIPDNSTLEHWVKDEGLTHQEIADRIFITSGVRVTRMAVSTALSRAGISKPKPRYDETIPWTVKMDHIKEYPARMLRLLGRRRAGNPMNDREAQRLDSWLAKLEEDHAVVGYDPDSQYGFYYIEKDDKLDGKNGIPIRIQRIHVDA